MNELKPGEIEIGPVRSNGLRTFKKVREDGRVECGLASDADEGISPDALAIAEIEPIEGRPRTYRVQNEVRFSMRGPAQVNSRAYQSGWDAIFAPRALAPSKAN